MKNRLEVGDTHRDFSKSMAKVTVSGGIGMFLAKFQYSS